MQELGVSMLPTTDIEPREVMSQRNVTINMVLSLSEFKERYRHKYGIQSEGFEARNYHNKLDLEA